MVVYEDLRFTARRRTAKPAIRRPAPTVATDQSSKLLSPCPVVGMPGVVVVPPVVPPVGGAVVGGAVVGGAVVGGAEAVGAAVGWAAGPKSKALVRSFAAASRVAERREAPARLDELQDRGRVVLGVVDEALLGDRAR